MNPRTMAKIKPATVNASLYERWLPADSQFGLELGLALPRL